MSKSSHTFAYKNDFHPLFFGVFGLAVVVWNTYSFGVPDLTSTGLKLLFWCVYTAVMFLIAFGAYYAFRLFAKLWGTERLIVIADRSITLPQEATALNSITLDFSRISEVYFSKGRYGQADNLIIKFDVDGHAYIGRDSLDHSEFEEICELLKARLNLDTLDVK